MPLDMLSLYPNALLKIKDRTVLAWGLSETGEARELNCLEIRGTEEVGEGGSNAKGCG